MNTTRRQFLRDAAGLAGVAVVGGALSAEADPQDPPGAKKFSISLAAWSVHRLFFDGKLKQIDLPKLTREEFGLDGLELVNNFFPAPTFDYCNDLRKRAADHGVKILLIMCDSEGDMSHADAAVRRQAVRNHRKWLDAAALLGCHSIRCNFGNAAPATRRRSVAGRRASPSWRISPPPTSSTSSSKTTADCRLTRTR